MSGEIARIGMWLRQYAIRMPNGELYSDVAPQAPVDDYSIPSPMRDMLGLGSWFGMMSTPAPATRVPTGPVIFSDYPAAKAKLDELPRRPARSASRCTAARSSNGSARRSAPAIWWPSSTQT